MGTAIKPCTRNSTDGAIQCSKSGPDICIPKQTLHQSLSQSFHSHFKLDELETGQRDLLVPNSVVYNSKKTKKAKAHLSSDKSADLYLFHQPPKYIPQSDQLRLVIVVSLDDKEHLPAGLAKKVCPELVGTLNFGSLVSSVDKSSPHQLFYCLSEVMYNKIMNDLLMAFLLEMTHDKRLMT
jgi:hypothetical protein